MQTKKCVEEMVNPLCNVLVVTTINQFSHSKSMNNLRDLQKDMLAVVNSN